MPESEADAARDGPRPIRPGRLRGGDAADGAHACIANRARRISAWPAASRSTASATAGSSARGRSSSCGSSRRRVTPAGRSAPRSSPGTAIWSEPRTATERVETPCSGAYLGPAFTDDEIERCLRDRRDAAYERLDRDGCSTRTAQAAGRRQGRRLVRRAHGVRPAGARSPQHPRRSAQPADAGADEPEDQVPRGVPAVRAQRAARAGVRVLRAGLRLALHVARRAGSGRAASRASPRSSRRLWGIDQAQRAAVGHPGGHPHRLLGANPDRVAARPTRTTTT